MEHSIKKFDLDIDNPILEAAKIGLNTCMQMAIAKAIETGSNEGSVTMKISFVMEDGVNEDTGETEMKPDIKYKVGYSVPMKESMEAKVLQNCRLMHGPEGRWLLVDNQISMDELMGEDEEDE